MSSQCLRTGRTCKFGVQLKTTPGARLLTPAPGLQTGTRACTLTVAQHAPKQPFGDRRHALSFSLNQRYVRSFGRDRAWRTIAPAATSAAGENKPLASSDSISEKLKHLYSMTRPSTLPQALALVFAGAWGATGSLWSLGAGQVLLFAGLTFLVNATSMMLNDYYDFKSGVDQVNWGVTEESDDTDRGEQGSSRTRALVEGLVSPGVVKTALQWIYGAVLALSCFLQTLPLRLIVMGATLVSYLYTGALKPITVLKNVTVASIVALAIGGGAVAALGSIQGLFQVAAPMGWIFLAVLYREILMDVNDIEGDAAAGVYTLPVLCGRQNALYIVTAILAAMTVGGAASPFLLNWQGGATIGWVRVLSFLNFFACMPMWNAMRRVFFPAPEATSADAKEDVRRAIKITEKGPMAFIGLSLLSLCH